MRTNFPPTKAAPTPRDSLRRALLLSGLLVIVWTAIAFLPDPEPPAESATNPVELAVQPATTEAADMESQEAAGTGSTFVLPESPSLFGPGYLLVLVILGIAGTWALWLKGRRDTDSPSSRLTEIGRFRLGPQQQIQLVRCAEEVLVLGVSNGGINLLKAYPADAFPAQATVAEPERESVSLTAAFKTLAQSLRTSPQAGKAKEPPQREALPPHGDHFHGDADLPEWTIATASAISDGPDFMHVLRRYAGKKTYKANTLYPPTGASN
ncbi:MAG: flagellar biosynthetic protein FliO [Rhodothermales bacterium]|nr:flagellar biosynthetic protein FliO [Rhodothermales bacterium]